MSTDSGSHPVARRRLQRDWSQAELARRAQIPRSTLSAIEAQRLTPSVTAALALARALQCSVEELFAGGNISSLDASQWAWRPRTDPSRYWEAEVSGKTFLYPVEGLSLNLFPHDGIWHRGSAPNPAAASPETTLMLACCDPAAGLLGAEYAKASGFRLIVFSRGGAEALDLLKRGLVHMAGLHRSTVEEPERNAETVNSELGAGFRLLRAVQWQEGLALATASRARSPRSVVKSARRWALREAGSAARECLDELCKCASGRVVSSHAAVAEAVRGGWADAGVCVQLSAENAGLNFVPVRKEALDFCFPAALRHDARIQALVRLLRSRSYRRMMAELPGYDTRETGEVTLR